MYPPLIMLMRKVLKGFEFKGYEFPENTMVMASPAVSHRIPEVFRNPDAFDPERFGPERAEDKKHPMSWIAFGGGRHKCMGIVFAQLQLKAIYSHVLRNFDIDLYGDVYEPDYERMLVGPRLPCRARFFRRNKRPMAAVA
jgi:sterol 14-demethylase